ncbi:MAG TPA: aminomethyl-transferring glycine dehydrogenase [Thermoanaerobaculia bacterium]|nr:aminomethyl-transferring glycine dehydrogenase [Thermoanaerobaculia bacterium]
MSEPTPRDASDSLLDPTDPFVPRHLGPRRHEVREMLDYLGFDSLDALVDACVPAAIRSRRPLQLDPPRGEHETLAELRRISRKNEVFRSFVGMGYYDTITPPVILRNVFENPGWYTQYTPYQAEIAQGRLEALLAFQTMVADLTGLPLANASLLDEATAAAEAMAMCHAADKADRKVFFAAADCHPQTLAVLATRAEPLGIELRVGDAKTLDLGSGDLFGILLQYPATDGRLVDHRELIARARATNVMVVMATDLLALALLVPPGELGAHVAVGSAQRFGVPMGLGGPHAAFLATDEAHARSMPGRIVGVSKDSHGRPALRLALQTREQHIRREKATSNICTAQVLLAVMAAMYAVYHGPAGLRRIAWRVHGAAAVLAAALRRMGLDCGEAPFFDTLLVRTSREQQAAVLAAAAARRLNLRAYDDGSIGVALDEAVEREELVALCSAFAAAVPDAGVPAIAELEASVDAEIPAPFARSSGFLTHEVFNTHRAEHEMLRYLHRLQARDLSLVQSMIPLGSCTMKLNATAEMIPLSWPELARMHPFAPPEQWRGYRELMDQLAGWLAEITGFAAVSLQPNAGSQGEYAGLLAIRAYHRSRGDGHRDVCLIPTSAHGTNPASAVMAGFRVVAVKTSEGGDVDVADLAAKAAQHEGRLAALMITYPSTHGVYEETIREVCDTVHRHGGQVYLDGANMNALVGLARPAELGADVCHLNLHKTFCIPHGGGGPGMGPIGVAPHLVPYLPGHPVIATGGEQAIGAVAAAPFGSPLILPISWMYIRMMGGEGLTEATKIAILNANYMAKKLGNHYPILYTGRNGLVAHEFIVDMRHFKNAGITVDDIAKRLMDWGFHAPTMSFPVASTMMVEPTESEPKGELDRFCEALIAIRDEVREVEQGRVSAEQSALRHAPHTAEAVTADAWQHPYSRQHAAFPAPWLKNHKFWPPVGRIDNVWGDRNLACTCEAVEAYAES